MSEPKLEKLVRERIRSLRQEKGLTQEALCERAGISVDSVNRIESGSRVPTLDTLARIARALGVSPGDLLQMPLAPVVAPPPSVARIVALVERERPEVQDAIEDVVRTVVRTLQRGTKKVKSRR